MKRLICAISLLLCALLLLAGCGGAASSSSSVAPTSSAPVSSSPASSAPSVVTSSAGELLDLAPLLATLSEAAALGDTIAVSELDLRANGITIDNVVSFAGAQSKLVTENGGTVIVIQAKDGMADSIKAELTAYRDALAADDRYAEFANARSNIAVGRVESNGNLVIYAVSATGQDGGYAALDAAIAAALA